MLLFDNHYIDISTKACPWQLPVLSYPHVVKSGWGYPIQGGNKKLKSDLHNILIAVIPIPVKRH